MLFAATALGKICDYKRDLLFQDVPLQSFTSIQQLFYTPFLSGSPVIRQCFGYPFTAPVTMPSIIFLEKAKYNTTIGSIVISIPDMIFG